MSSTAYRARTRLSLSAMPDGTGLLLDLESKFYFTLNRTGLHAWQVLQGGACTADALASELATAFDVDAETARRDASALLEELEREGLVERVG